METNETSGNTTLDSGTSTTATIGCTHTVLPVGNMGWQCPGCLTYYAPTVSSCSCRRNNAPYWYTYPAYPVVTYS